MKDKKQFEINYNVPKKSSVPEPKVARERDYAEIAEEIIKKGEKHDAIKVIKDAYDEIIKALDECEKASKRFRELGLGATEDATVIMQKVQPKVLALAKVAGAVAKELEQRLGGA